MPVTILHVDIEGGWGGSSVSLFELVRRLDRTRISPVVAYRQKGPAAEWYAELGIPAYHVPEIASFVPRRTKALKNLLASLPRLACLRHASDRLAQIARDHECGVVHLNYEGLFLLASRLRKKLAVPMIAHSRAHLPVTHWGRWLVRSLAHNVNAIFFISPQEESRWQELLGGADGPRGEIMWNIARAPLPRQPFTARPEIVFLGNVAYAKGPDRLIDIAAAIARKNGPRFCFAIYGRANRETGFARGLERRIGDLGLSDAVELRGHIADPASVLARAFALIRPSRDDDPWGRDVIEAGTAGVPVLATGTFDGVVQHGRTGYLFGEFDAESFADSLIALHEDPGLWQRLSANGAALGKERFGGAAQAEQFMRKVERLAGRAVAESA